MIAALLLAVLAQDADVLVMKDGRKLSGLIVEEDDQKVMLRIQAKGVKGAGGTVAIRKDEIAEIRRMPAAERERQAKAKRGPPRRIPAQPAEILGRPGFVAAGDFFEVRTTAGPDLASALAETLQQAYESYLLHFAAGAGAKLPVIVLADRAEYDAKNGRRVADPAFFDPKANVVLACGSASKDEDARLREGIAARRKEIEGWRTKVADAEELAEAAVKEVKENAATESAAEKDKLRREGKATPDALREIDRRWASTVDLAIQLSRSLETQTRDEATKAIAECEKAIRRDESLLAERNRTMFQALFHECFHAFARNRLPGIPRWLEEGMALRFETCAMVDGELTHGGRNRALVKLLGEGKLPPLASVLRGDALPTAHDGAIDRSSRGAAVAWALADHLCPRMTTEQVAAYLAATAKGADPADALATTLAEPLKKIDEAVRAHIASLR